MDFSKRSYDPELLDRDDIPFRDIERNMQELDTINTRLGGHRITIKGFSDLIGSRTHVSVCEIGCGGGDNLKALRRWAAKKNITLSMTGIDIKSACIDFAAQQCESPNNVAWICSDYRKITLDPRPDIIFCSLFCHHFSEEGVEDILSWMHTNSSIGFFINDLQRHPIAYHAISLLTKVFSRSYLVQNDAPLSVLRGFSRQELELIAKKAAKKSPFIHRITNEWAFRWLLVARNKEIPEIE
jgi:2-polyprenyl-3-methyl-5-hydroxy-6-metoxy-1,4-benzoquinol methylase